MQAEDPAGTGVGVVDGLARALDYAVAQRHRGDAVTAPKVDGDHLLAHLGHPIGVLRVGNVFGRGQHLEWPTAGGAGDVPIPAGQCGFEAHPWCLLAVAGAPVKALAHSGLRRGHDYARQFQVLCDGDLVNEGGGHNVYV